jgi:ACS family hexuronate transporter-like MFS transporter
MDVGQTNPQAELVIPQVPPGRRTNYRWQVCALLLFATTVNYMDRQVLGLLAPQLQHDLKWTEAQYSYIGIAFQVAYAVGLFLSGRLLDAVGTKVGYALSITVWSLSSLGHTLARGWVGFAVARVFLGLGESGNFPAAVKTTAEWFPRRDRALAAGVFNSGSNLGVIVAASVVPFIASAPKLGWRYAFCLTAALDAVWLVAWLVLYHKPEEQPGISATELAYVRQDPPDAPAARVGMDQLLAHRQAWAVAAAKCFTDPVWWFLQFWLAKYFSDTYGVKTTALALPFVIVYLMADVGSIGGGWISSTLIRRGLSVNGARKTAMFLCGALVVPMAFASHVHAFWGSVTLFALAAAGHQGWSCNVYTLASDMYPRRAVGSVVGFASMAGAAGSVAASLVIGRVLTNKAGNYGPLLVAAGFAYVVTLVIVHLLAPRLTPVEEPPGPPGFEVVPVAAA